MGKLKYFTPNSRAPNKYMYLSFLVLIATTLFLYIRQKVSKCKSDTTWPKWFTKDSP